jgi:hypothetical protein
MRLALLIALGAILLGYGPTPPTRGQDVLGASRIGREPSAVAAFVAAFARGDETRADGLASPLYRDEWARRAVSIEERLAVFPQPSRVGSTDEWIRFRFEGGVRDASGFGHLLYTARPPGTGGDGAASVWRVDLDPQNRVIWCELVWLFSENTSALRPASDLPAGVGAGTVLMGVRSESAPEGYYAVAPDGALGPGARPSALLFLAVGPEGEPHLGAWSYGDRPAISPGRRRVAPPSPEPQVAALRRSYLETL